MAKKAKPIWIDSDNDVTWTGAYAGGAYLNSATVTWALTEEDATPVANGTCSYVAASNGNYLGTIDAGDVDELTENTKYLLTVLLVSGGYRDTRKAILTAAYRPFDDA